MDPAIIAILSNRRTRTNFVFDIQTPVPRRWCPFPGGLVVLGLTYTFVDINVGSITETSDGTSGLECSFSIDNVDRIASELVLDSANRNAPIVIRRVWFDPAITPPAWAADPDAAQIGSEIWLEGRLESLQFEGKRVAIAARAELGQRGKIPSYRSSDVMTSHKPPDPGTKIGWARLEVSGG